MILVNRDDAVKSYEKTQSLLIRTLQRHITISALLYKELNQLDEAVKCYEKAIAIKPDFAEAHNNLGNVLKGSRSTGCCY